MFEEFMEFEVGLLLLALCVENLLKGLWCGKNHAAINSVTNQRHLAALADPTSKLTTHNLGEIARATGVDLSASEFDALDALEGIIMWEGRYPTPLTVTDYHKYFQHGGPISKFFAGPSIFTIPLPVPPVIEAIIEKINEELNLIPDSARF